MEPTEHSHFSDADPKSPETQDLSAGEKFTLDLDKINAAIEELLTDTSIDPIHHEEAWMIRALIVENFIDSLEPTPDNPDPRTRVQFDIMVDTALIYEKVGNKLRYLEKLDCAEEFAHKQHLDDVLISLTEEIDEKTKELGNSPEELVMKLRGHIDFLNREYLRESLQEGIDENDFLGDIYGMIFDEGGDPDEVFALLGITGQSE